MSQISRRKISNMNDLHENREITRHSPSDGLNRYSKFVVGYGFKCSGFPKVKYGMSVLKKNILLMVKFNKIMKNDAICMI